MDFGVALATPADAWKTVQRAEAAGFRTAWFYDTQMLSADLFTTMGAAAVKSDRVSEGSMLEVTLPATTDPLEVARRARANLEKPGRVAVCRGRQQRLAQCAHQGLVLGCKRLKPAAPALRIQRQRLI